MAERTARITHYRKGRALRRESCLICVVAAQRSALLIFLQVRGNTTREGMDGIVVTIVVIYIKHTHGALLESFVILLAVGPLNLTECIHTGQRLILSQTGIAYILSPMKCDFTAGSMSSGIGS